MTETPKPGQHTPDTDHPPVTPVVQPSTLAQRRAAAAGATAPAAAVADESTAALAAARPTPEPRQHTPFVPLLIFFVAGVAWSGFQFYQLQQEKTALIGVHAAQEAPLQQAQRARASLDNLATETRRLAEAGNPNARLVIEELKRRGITINAPAAAPTASAAGK